MHDTSSEVVCLAPTSSCSDEGLGAGLDGRQQNKDEGALIISTRLKLTRRDLVSGTGSDGQGAARARFKSAGPSSTGAARLPLPGRLIGNSQDAQGLGGRQATRQALFGAPHGDAFAVFARLQLRGIRSPERMAGGCQVSGANPGLHSTVYGVLCGAAGLSCMPAHLCASLINSDPVPVADHKHASTASTWPMGGRRNRTTAESAWSKACPPVPPSTAPVHGGVPVRGALNRRTRGRGRTKHDSSRLRCWMHLCRGLAGTVGPELTSSASFETTVEG
jgi:hypothetical protein